MAAEIARRRLHSQRLAGAAPGTPGELVHRLGAVQAQDYPGALWAVGQRLGGRTEQAVEQALADRTIVRTWPMRGTLHFVAAADARWLLKLLAAPVVARSTRRLARDYGLDEATIARARAVLEGALSGRTALPRRAVYATLEAAGIATDRQRGLQIVWWLAQEGVLCFGPRLGKQPTFVLLDEWLPPARTPDRDEALAELARRYFTGHGPATVSDFAWWSGLPAAQARAALDMARPFLAEEMADGRSYWLAADAPPAPPAPPAVHLLPAYDEFFVGYRDRSAALHGTGHEVGADLSYLLGPTVVYGGRVAGTWKRIVEKDRVVVTPRPVDGTPPPHREALAEAVSRYAAFLGVPVELA